METLEYIKNKYKVDIEQPSPILLPMNRFSGLCKLFAKLHFRVGVEIGVERGRYSRWLLLTNKKLKLFCIDPYLVYSEYVESHRNDAKEMKSRYEHAKRRLDGLNCKFIKKTSMEAIKDFEDNSLDFVFIDGNHTFEYAVNDIAEWSKKVKPGGIVSGHDYWNSSEEKEVVRPYLKKYTPLDRIKLVQVKDAVDAWIKTNQIKPWFLLSDQTWFYVK